MIERQRVGLYGSSTCGATLADAITALESNDEIRYAEALPAGVGLVRVLADGARQSHRLTVAR